MRRDGDTDRTRRRATDPETERVHLELMRRAGPAPRIRLALSLSRTVMSLSREGLDRVLEEASPEDVSLRSVAPHYGDELAGELRADLASRRP
jgi:hypothetical protein